jgi:uncharacterized protein YbaA (DUF1428 family)
MHTTLGDAILYASKQKFDAVNADVMPDCNMSPGRWTNPFTAGTAVA